MEPYGTLWNLMEPYGTLWNWRMANTASRSDSVGM